MEIGDETLRRTFAATGVQLAFAFLLWVWAVLEVGLVPESLYAPLHPVWLPSYLAFAGTSGVRSAVLPWLGSGVPFDAVVVLLTYVEAVLLAGLLRSLQRAYRRGRGGRSAAS